MAETILALLLGYKSANLFTRPQSKLRQKIPFLKVGFVQVLPSIKIYIRGRIIHIHHWLHLSVLFILTFNYHSTLVDPSLIKGVLGGWIIQGFSFSDWNRIIINEKNKTSQYSSA